mgnify:CR=1 FL=1
MRAIVLLESGSNHQRNGRTAHDARLPELGCEGGGGAGALEFLSMAVVSLSPCLQCWGTGRAHPSSAGHARACHSEAF